MIQQKIVKYTDQVPMNIFINEELGKDKIRLFYRYRVFRKIQFVVGGIFLLVSILMNQLHCVLHQKIGGRWFPVILGRCGCLIVPVDASAFKGTMGLYIIWRS